MEKAFNKFAEFVFIVRRYLKAQVESAKQVAADKISGFIANIAAGIIRFVFFLLFFLFASVSLSLIIGEWIGKLWAGFLIVAGFYLLVGIIVWKARKKLIKLPVLHAIVEQLSKHDSKE